MITPIFFLGFLFILLLILYYINKRNNKINNNSNNKKTDHPLTNTAHTEAKEIVKEEGKAYKKGKKRNHKNTLIVESSDESEELEDIEEIEEIEESQESINKIHQIAENTRQQLLNFVNKHTNIITDNLKNLAQQLKKARDDDDYIETDLQNKRSGKNSFNY